MKKEPQIVALIRGVVGSYILHHADLRIIVRESVGFDLFVGFEAHVGDLARIIGKKGANFRALSTIASMAGRRDGHRVTLLKLPRTGVGVADRYPAFALNREWPKESVRKLAGEMAVACLPTGAVIVDIEDVSVSDSSVTIRVEPGVQEFDLLRFSEAVSVLISAAGSTAGRVLHTSVVNNLRF